MSETRRYAWRFWLAGSEATVDVLATTYEEAVTRARDEALGLAARLQEWASSEEGSLPLVAYTNFCASCGSSLRFWCTACKERLPKKGGIAH